MKPTIGVLLLSNICGFLRGRVGTVLLTTLLALSTSSLTTALAQEGPGAPSLPRLSIEGNLFVTEDGRPISLRGVSLCSLAWEPAPPLIKRATGAEGGWGANIVRLPVQPREWRRSGGKSYIRHLLDPAVEACRRENVYCIIDWHEIAPWNTPEVAKELEYFWGRVARRYANNKNIIFELFNEPTEPKRETESNWLAWRSVAQKWVDQIRAHAPETIILIGSPHWSQMTSFAAKHPFSGTNLAYVFHSYPNRPSSDWDTLFGNAANSVPVFLTEWGWSAKTRGEVFAGSRETFGVPLKTYLNARPQIGWTAWSFDPRCAPAMLGQDTEMRDLVRQWLESLR